VADERLGVAVLAYGGGGEFAAVIDSLLAEGVRAASILVIHNQAEPGEAPPNPISGVEVIQTDRNLGYAGGMNVGVAKLMERGSGQILLLTHDARLRPGALDLLRTAAASQPGFGVLAPALLLAGTEVPYSFGGVTSRSGATSHLKGLPADFRAGVFACDWVDGGTMLIRRELFERVGSFDERFWGYCEEADLCLRARRAGFSVGVVPAAQADQAPGASKRIGAWAYLITRNGIEYAWRAAGLRGLIAITFRSIWIVALNLVRTALRATRVRPGSPDEPWALAIGTSRGTLDRFRGRWGPPPADLPGMGDLGNA
jgi:N-acetylglucosaminyl-diphospho-decaprenol L-rhamnosyltransferase